MEYCWTIEACDEGISRMIRGMKSLRILQTKCMCEILFNLFQILMNLQLNRFCYRALLHRVFQAGTGIFTNFEDSGWVCGRTRRLWEDEAFVL